MRNAKIRCSIFSIDKSFSFFSLAEILGMAGDERRPSTVLGTNPFIEVTDTTGSSSMSPSTILRNDRTPSPVDEPMPWKSSPKPHRHRVTSETQYADTEVEELLTMLRETESLEEQGDILQYLVREGFDIFILNL